MNLENALSYIDSKNGIANLINLKAGKSWCFMLNNSIQTKLSTSSRQIHDIKQILVITPTIAEEILGTMGTILDRHFGKLDLPEPYEAYDSIKDVIEDIETMPCDSPVSATQIIYLCLGILMDYIHLYDNTTLISSDEKLLLQGLIFVVFNALVKIAVYAEIECQSRKVLIYFNEIDIQ